LFFPGGNSISSGDKPFFPGDNSFIAGGKSFSAGEKPGGFAEKASKCAVLWFSGSKSVRGLPQTKTAGAMFWGQTVNAKRF